MTLEQALHLDPAEKLMQALEVMRRRGSIHARREPRRAGRQLRRRGRDWIDAQHLLQFTAELDLGRVREHLARITARGYAREQDLEAKLTLVLRDVGHPTQ